MKGYVFVILPLAFASCNNTSPKPNTANKKSLETTDTLTGKYVSIDLDGGESCPITISISKKGQGYEYHIVNKSLDTIGQVGVENGYLSLKGVKWSSYTNGDEEQETVHNSIEIEKNKDTLLIQNYGNAMNQYQKLDCGLKYIKLVKKAQ